MTGRIRIELPVPAAPLAPMRDPLTVSCPTCGAAVGASCRSLASIAETTLAIEHRTRRMKAGQ